MLKEEMRVLIIADLDICSWSHRNKWRTAQRSHSLAILSCPP